MTERPSAKSVLVASLQEKESVLIREAVKFCRGFWAPYPEGGDTLFLWRTALMVGIHISFKETAEELFYHCLRAPQLFEPIPANGKPEAGDFAFYKLKDGFGFGVEYVLLDTQTETSYRGVGPDGEPGMRTRVLEYTDEPTRYTPRVIMGFFRLRCLECQAAKAARELAIQKAELNAGNAEL